MRHKNSLPIAIIVAVWFGFISWRPWFLGFYHDDWSLLTVTSAYGRALIEGGQTRPLNVALGYLGVLIFGENAFSWHVYGAVLVLVCSIGIYTACNAVTKRVFEDNVARKAAVVAACTWMLYPWSLGYTAWPVMFPGLVAIALFASALTNIAAFPVSSSNLRWAAYKVIIASLIYEAFWFSFIPMAIIFVSLNRHQDWRKTLKVFGILGAPQVLLVVWNQMLARWGASGGKKINMDWVDIAIYFPVRVISDFGIGRSWALCFGIIVSFILLVLIRRSRQSMGISLLIGACATGIAVSVALYAAAGYAIMPTGAFSRSTIVINVWLSLATSVVMALVISSNTNRLSNSVIILVILAGLIRLGWANVHQSARWAESWLEQRQILEKLSLMNFDVMKANSILILDFPKKRDVVEGLEGYWDTNAALYVSSPRLKRAIENGQLWVTVSKNNEWITRWDGSKLTQYWCHSPDKPLWQHQANNAYSVDGRWTAIVELPNPSVLGCAPS